jgi:predicted DCC family thiol-disulfide oxidoreductase YuxK
MASLPNKTLIYDDSCPMCAAYTQAFVKLHWLDAKGRIGFQEVPEDQLKKLDADRARHEIPLLDRNTGEVTYGQDALFLILATRFPFLQPLFRLTAFRFVIHLLYQLITYNRRVMVGSRKDDTGFDCSPDFHLGWRWGYIVLTSLLTLSIVLPFAARIKAEALPLIQNLFAESSVLVLAFSLWGLFQKRKTSYYGQWVSILLIGSLGLLPGLWLGAAPWFCLLLSSSLLVWQFRRRWELMWEGMGVLQFRKLEVRR